MRVDERLPQGNAGRLRVDREGRVHFMARRAVRGLPGAAPRSMWWAFRILGAAGRRVACVWERTADVLGAGTLGAVVPVARDAGAPAYRRVPEAACRYRPEAQRFEFVVPCASDETWVYYCYPYGPADLETFLRQIASDRRVRVEGIGQSAGGRPCRLVSLSDPARGGRKRQVWLRARSHAGEVTGSYVLEGALLEALARRTLLRRTDVHAVPFLDVDGVALGSYGKDRPPRDFNRDFCLRPLRPEVRRFLAAVAGRSGGTADVHIDLHAPAPGDMTFLVPPHAALLDAGQWARHAAFAARLADRAPASCPAPLARFTRHARGSMDWARDLFEQTGTAFLWRAHGALTFTLETAYHRSETGALLTPAHWRALGRALMETVDDCLAGRIPLLPRPPARPRGRVGAWLLVNRLRHALARRRGTAIALTPLTADAFALVATPVLTQGHVVRYRSGGPASGTIFVREMAGDLALPTGRGAQAPLHLDAARTWRRLPEPRQRGLARRRLLIELRAWEGTVTLDVGTP